MKSAIEKLKELRDLIRDVNGQVSLLESSLERIKLLIEKE